MLQKWLAIPSLPGYDASDRGKIRSWWSKKRQWVMIEKNGEMVRRKRVIREAAPHTVRRTKSRFGYSPVVHVWLRGSQTVRAVDMLICEVFIRPREIPVHLDGNVKNNHASNLRWGFRDERQRLRDPKEFYKLDQAKADEIRRRAASGERTTDLAKEFGVTPAAVSRIKKGVIWKRPIFAPEKPKDLSVTGIPVTENFPGESQ